MDEIEAIQQLDEDILQWDAAFVLATVALNAAMLGELNLFLDGIATSLRGRATTSEEWSANMRSVIYFNAGLTASVYRLGFLSMLDGLVERMKESAVRIDSYFGLVLADYNPAGYSAVINQLTEQTRTIMAATLEQTYSKVIGETLTLGVMTKSTAAELRATLMEKLGQESVAVNPLSGVASESLYTFSRAYSQTIAEAQKLKYYYYMGTAVVHSRPFCVGKKGKAFTQAEVESWPAQEWAGKIPGTNKQTIYWYCGGYRCRDRLLPISKTMYLSLTNEADGKIN